MRPPSGLETGADKAARLARMITEWWRELGEPCTERAVECALAFADARAAAFDPATAVLAHGDAHAWNALQDPCDADAFKLVDPDPLLAERAYDVAIPMREWSADLLPDPVRLGGERCAHLSALTGVDERAIWEWGFVERVSTGLLALRVGMDAAGRDLLAVADALSSTP